MGTADNGYDAEVTQKTQGPREMSWKLAREFIGCHTQSAWAVSLDLRC